MAVLLAKQGRHPVKAIVRVLRVSRSNVLERRRERPAEPPTESSPIVESAENEAILSDVRALVNERASYGYRRITALLNRTRVRIGKVKRQQCRAWHTWHVPRTADSREISRKGRARKLLTQRA
jgi:hypothetical protein